MTQGGAADLQGYDPYDGLRAPLGSLCSSAVTRQMLVQLRKRLPVPSVCWGIRPYAMAKTIGGRMVAVARTGDLRRAGVIVEALRAASGNLGDGAWGYEFDVQTRWAFYPAGSPNLIATVFVARGCGTAGVVLGDTDLLHELALSAAFLRRDLMYCGENPYFRYTLTSDRLVHNANLLGAGLVSMDGALRGEDSAVRIGHTAAQTTMTAQRDDGSWSYGEGASLGWSDNFHTAYNLDGLLQVWLATGDAGVRACLDRGVDHWVRDFFGADGEPKYYPHKPYPYDIHSAGTAMDVAARLATWGWDTGDLAERVAQWTERNLLNPRTGDTYYQKHRMWTDRRHFVRWGDAHWALGMSALGLLRESKRDPLERAVALASGVMPDA